MLNFSENQFKTFKSYFKIKDNPTNVEKKFIDKTIKYTKYIKWIPGLKMIWIWNSISMNCSNKNSDIDLFILSAPHRMWLVRILVTFIFQILWVRKNHQNYAGRFCLSFFSTTDALDLSQIAIENDIYLHFRVIYMKPILDYDDTYNNFLEINSNWINFSKYKEIINNNKKQIHITGKSWWNKWKILDIFDKVLKKLFLPKTLKHYEKLWKPFWVIIDDNILKFHDNDIRKNIRKELVCEK